MIKVHVTNLSGLTGLKHAITKDATRQIAADLADIGRATWIQFASTKLQTTRMDYINGIQKVAESKGFFAVNLVGVLPNMVENGWSRRNLHETLIGDNTKGWHTAKDGGRYRAIPFRQKTPGAGKTGGVSMEHPFRPSSPMSLAAPKTTVKDTAALAKKIYRAAKKMGPSDRLPPGLSPKLRPHHTTDIHAGMKRMFQPISGGKFQSTYMTFRTISVDPSGNPRPPGKWFHPGIRARHFVRDVAAHIDKIAPAHFEQYVKGITGQP